MAGLGAIFVAVVAGGRDGSAAAFVLGIAGLGVGLTAGAGSQALQRRADAAAFPGPSPVLVFVALFAYTLVAGYALDAANVVPEGPPAVLVSVAVAAAIALGMVGLVVVSPGSLSWRQMGLRLPGPDEGSVVGDLAWGAALAVPTVFASGLLNMILVGAFGVSPDPTIPPSTGDAGLIVNLLAVAVLAPLWEEVFFRGFVTTAWALTAGVRAAIVRGALFFAFIHVVTITASDFGEALEIAFIAFTVRLPVAFVLGWVFVRRRTLVAPMVLHATYNTIPLLVLAATGSAGSLG